MKKGILLVLFGFLFVSLYSQSTDRFIRIIGNSEKVYESNITRVYFVLNEIAPNEYKKISYKSLDAVYADFLEMMTKIGFRENQIKQTNTEINKYNKTRTKSYYVDFTSQKQLDGFSAIQNEGFRVKDVRYLYANIDPNTESDLSLQAIQDAKRKAQRICDELGMKLGKILNIEDKSSGCCGNIDESKKSETTMKYKITITFELID